LLKKLSVTSTSLKYLPYYFHEGWNELTPVGLFSMVITGSSRSQNTSWKTFGVCWTGPTHGLQSGNPISMPDKVEVIKKQPPYRLYNIQTRKIQLKCQRLTDVPDRGVLHRDRLEWHVSTDIHHSWRLSVLHSFLRNYHTRPCNSRLAYAYRQGTLYYVNIFYNTQEYTIPSVLHGHSLCGITKSNQPFKNLSLWRPLTGETFWNSYVVSAVASWMTNKSTLQTHYNVLHYNANSIIMRYQSWLQTLICVLAVRPRQGHTLSNPVLWQNWMATCLGYTLHMKMLFARWPIMVHETHTRRRKSLGSQFFTDLPSDVISNSTACRANVITLLFPDAVNFVLHAQHSWNI